MVSGAPPHPEFYRNLTSGPPPLRLLQHRPLSLGHATSGPSPSHGPSHRPMASTSQSPWPRPCAPQTLQLDRVPDSVSRVRGRSPGQRPTLPAQSVVRSPHSWRKACTPRDPLKERTDCQHPLCRSPALAPYPGRWVRRAVPPGHLGRRPEEEEETAGGGVPEAWGRGTAQAPWGRVLADARPPSRVCMAGSERDHPAVSGPCGDPRAAVPAVLDQALGARLSPPRRPPVCVVTVTLALPLAH
ncbi:opioid growth factor receptor-like [Cervus elaphus]|uniref:opioid growth factor receptor-like n=1 Tax=Cervus canadensis TaxID=1574408 RepID=UPI001CA3541F|nr:opioid growth factor receptor-like [Cervus canadensis]XP_043744211.1 opioid growth factor receptor-like [Cervus elaphus]